MTVQSNLNDISEKELNDLRNYKFLIVLSFMCSLLLILMSCSLFLGFTDTCQNDGKNPVSINCSLLVFGTSCLIFAVTCPCLLIIFEKINQSWCRANEEPDDYEIQMRVYP